MSSPGLAFSDTKNLGNVTPAVPVPVQSLNFTINPLVKVSALPDQVVELSSDRQLSAATFLRP